MCTPAGPRYTCALWLSSTQDLNLSSCQFIALAEGWIATEKDLDLSSGAWRYVSKKDLLLRTSSRKYVFRGLFKSLAQKKERKKKNHL